jgi:hypothetical protein
LRERDQECGSENDNRQTTHDSPNAYAEAATRATF